jgi:serine phosphatase RsbU (regulator of sigma subunit)
MVNRFKKEQDMIIAEKKIESGVELAHSLQTNILPQFLTSAPTEYKKEDSFNWLIPYMTKEDFKKDDVLFRKEDNADKIYYIKNGSIRLEEINKVVGKDEIIGETGIFSPFHKRTASAICETDVEAYTLSQEKINELLYKYPSLLFVLIQLSIRRVIVNLTETVTEKERIESELKIAHSIQTSILPKIFPDKKEFNIFAMMEPAKEVGGDFYDFFFIGENKFCFVIGDASGKGIPAALFMVISKTLIRTEALRDLPPDEILFRVNNILYPNNDECMFVTTFCAILDLKTGELQFANAGHNPPLLYIGDHNFEFLDMDHGFVLGGMPDFKYTCQKLSLKPGGIIFLYTDGVTEAMDKEESLFSDERLKKTLSELTDTNVEGIITDIIDKLKHFTGETPQSDDITMLALKFNS